MVGTGGKFGKKEDHDDDHVMVHGEVKEMENENAEARPLSLAVESSALGQISSGRVFSSRADL